jgi:hypothetical protein
VQLHLLAWIKLAPNPDCTAWLLLLLLLASLLLLPLRLLLPAYQYLLLQHHQMEY